MAWNNKELIPVGWRIEKYVIDDLKKEAATDMVLKGQYSVLAHNILKAWVNGTEMPPRYIPKAKRTPKNKK